VGKGKDRGGREAKKPKKDKKAKAAPVRTTVIPQPERHNAPAESDK
jgi:hypothetical protein